MTPAEFQRIHDPFRPRVLRYLARRTAWTHPDQAKARKAIALPLSAAAVVVLREQTGKHLKYVFSFRGKPITQVSTKAWYAGPGRGRNRERPLP